MMKNDTVIWIPLFFITIPLFLLIMSRLSNILRFSLNKKIIEKAYNRGLFSQKEIDMFSKKLIEDFNFILEYENTYWLFLILIGWVSLIKNIYKNFKGLFKEIKFYLSIKKYYRKL
jgi:hypothetical protein